MPCKCSKKREATSTRQTLHLKIHSTINNPTAVAHSLPHLQSRNRGTKNITKKIKACSQVAAKYLMQRKRKEKCRLHQLWWLHMCHPHMRWIKKTYCWRGEQKSKQTASLMEEDVWEPREATRTQSCMGPAELTKSLPSEYVSKEGQFKHLHSSVKFQVSLHLLTFIAATFIPENTDQNVPLATPATKHLQWKCGNVSVC